MIIFAKIYSVIQIVMYMIKINKQIWEKVSSDFKVLYTSIMPHSKPETIIVVSTLIWFLLFSMFFAFSVDFSYKNEVMGYDGIFYIGLDNPKLRLDKIISWNLRHPIFVILNYPILLIDAILPAKCHVAIFAFFSSLIMAFSNLLIYKIGRQLSLNTVSFIIPVILFPTFAHVLLLSGQAETYVYTIFFMLLSILLAHTGKSNIITDNIIFARRRWEGWSERSERKLPGSTAAAGVRAQKKVTNNLLLVTFSYCYSLIRVIVCGSGV